MDKKHSYKTKNRQMILDYLKDNKDKVLYVTDIANYMETQDSPVNKTTIYRYLDKLVDEQCLMKFVADKGEKAGYQFVEKDGCCHNHLHMQCMECGKVIHLDCEFMADISNHIDEHHGFKLNCSNSMLYGLCRDCNEKKDK